MIRGVRGDILLAQPMRPLLERQLGDLPIPVYVYCVYEASHAAKEG
jgi:hypothetical protein